MLRSLHFGLGRADLAGGLLELQRDLGPGVDLASFVRPTLTVVDGTRVMVRGGPQGGSLDYIEVRNTVLCATDQVAADARSAEYLGIMPGQVGHIVLAQEAGLGSMDYRASGFQEVLG